MSPMITAITAMTIHPTLRVLRKQPSFDLTITVGFGGTSGCSGWLGRKG